MLAKNGALGKTIQSILEEQKPKMSTLPRWTVHAQASSSSISTIRQNCRNIPSPGFWLLMPRRHFIHAWNLKIWQRQVRLLKRQPRSTTIRLPRFKSRAYPHLTDCHARRFCIVSIEFGGRVPNSAIVYVSREFQKRLRDIMAKQILTTVDYPPEIYIRDENAWSSFIPACPAADGRSAPESRHS